VIPDVAEIIDVAQDMEKDRFKRSGMFTNDYQKKSESAGRIKAYSLRIGETAKILRRRKCVPGKRGGQVTVPQKRQALRKKKRRRWWGWGTRPSAQKESVHLDGTMKCTRQKRGQIKGSLKKKKRREKKRSCISESDEIMNGGGQGEQDTSTSVRGYTREDVRAVQKKGERNPAGRFTRERVFSRN